MYCKVFFFSDQILDISLKNNFLIYGTLKINRKYVELMMLIILVGVNMKEKIKYEKKHGTSK